MITPSPAKQLAAFLAKFNPPIVKRALVAEAIAFGETTFAGKGRLVVRSISKKQRPRR